MKRRLLWLFCAALLSAQQGNDIFRRLRAAPLATGQGDAAAGLLAKHDFAAVLKLLESAPSASAAERAELLCLRGGVAFLAGPIAAAASQFSQAEKLSPLSREDSFTLAMAQLKLGQNNTAAARLNLLSAQAPDNPLYVYWLGKVAYDERRYDETIVQMRRVIVLDPRSVRAFNSLGLAFDMQGRFEPAREALEKAAALNRQQTKPSAWPPHDLGFLLLRMDRPADAAAALREALQHDPSFALAHYHLGRALEKQGLDAEAEGAYNRAIQLDLTSPDACYALANLYKRLNRQTDAARTFAEFKRRKGA